MILQLPTAVGHRGGCLKVEYKGKEKVFSNQENSHERFYLSAYYGSCNHEMEVVTKGFKLTFVYSLVWENTNTVIPQDFPVFLTALKEIQQALTPWLSQQRASSQAENKAKTKKEDILFFVLEGKYKEDTFTFHHLEGKDQNLAELLRRCPFLDVHLVMVTRKKTITQYYGECLRELSDAEDYNDEGIKETSEYKFSRWIDSTGVGRNLRIELDVKEQYVGPNCNLLTSSETNPDKTKKVPTDERYEKTIKKNYFYHGVLTIWPRHQSFDFYCLYDFESLLDRMETSSLKSDLDIHVNVTEDLRKIISYCSSDPDLVWNNWAARMKSGELTARLLRLCTVLNAREEGLALLKVLADNGEGVRTNLVAQAIADFEYQITGNSLFSCRFNLSIIVLFLFVRLG